MDLALAIHHLLRHKLWLLLVSVVAIVAALSVTLRLSFSPFEVKSKSLASGAATVGILVDSKDATITPPAASVDALSQRAALYAQLLKAQPVRQMISSRTGIPWKEISVDGQTGAQGPTAESNQPRQVQRSAEITSETSSNLVYFTVNSGYPIINVYTQAPTAQEASTLAQASVDSLSSYVDGLQTQLQVSPDARARLIQLGAPQAGKVASGANLSVSLIVLFGVFVGGCLLILFIPRIASEVRQARDSDLDWMPESEQGPDSDDALTRGSTRKVKSESKNRESVRHG